MRALHDPAFWSALGNTAFFVPGTIPFTTAPALALALALGHVVAPLMTPVLAVVAFQRQILSGILAGAEK
jgi:hypothetical protein